MSKNRLFVLVKTLFLLFISICFSQTNPVDDLVADAGVSINEIKISFTYPGPDILPEGSNYYIKYSTYLDGVIWSTTTANIVISTYNVYPLQQQVITVSNLEGNTTYYFHLWISSGTEQLLSGISNRATYYLLGEVVMMIQKTSMAEVKRPGDEVIYSIIYKNVGNIKTTWFKIEDKIPANTLYKQNSIKINNIQKTDDSDEEDGPDAEFTNGRIIVIFDDTESQILPQQTGVIEFKVIIK